MKQVRQRAMATISATQPPVLLKHCLMNRCMVIRTTSTVANYKDKKKELNLLNSTLFLYENCSPEYQGQGK